MNSNFHLILINIEKQITGLNERYYFWTHEKRYEYILGRIVETYLPRTEWYRGHGTSLQNKTALDIGCYPYHLGKALEYLGFEVFGISSEHEPIKDNPRIKTVNIETETFPFEDHKFDFILWSEVLEHLIRSPEIPLREIKRVLKPGGICLITTPNVLRSINRFSLLFGRSIYPRHEVFYDEEIGDASLNFRHNKEYTMKEMEKIVSDSGLEIKHQAYFISYTPFRKRKIPDRLTVKLIKILNYFVMLLFPDLRDTLCLEVTKSV